MSERSASDTLTECVFCSRMAQSGVLATNALAIAFWDAFPVSPGHALIVPRRHEPDFFSLSAEERAAMFDLLMEVRAVIDTVRQPVGYNVGLNIGLAAGQTVPHAHLHVIPRFDGDHPDPRGGIRWVLPERAAYWK